MKTKILREGDGRWCEVTIELKDGRLSICGSEGEIITVGYAKELAIEHWRSFFEENPAELGNFCKKFKLVCDEEVAAKHVVQLDGPYHGLDAHHVDTDRVYTVDTCGQITESIAYWFPEVEPYLKWHLNDMKAGCEHQEALGWGRGKDIALSKDDMTEAQLGSLNELANRKAMDWVERKLREFDEGPRATRYGLLTEILRRAPSASEFENIDLPAGKGRIKPERQMIINHFVKLGTKQFQVESQVFKDSINAPCPTCGYRYGTAWLKRELPLEVIEWATTAHATIEGKVK